MASSSSAARALDFRMARAPGGGHRSPPLAPRTAFVFHNAIVINEIMYHHALLASTNGSAATPSSEQWIELYNRGTNTVDLADWELDGGIEYRFGPGRQLGPGGYLIVAGDAASLRRDDPDIEIVGDFTGRLSHRGEILRLIDASGNPADEVCYFDGGHWPGYADGGGSSLELRDPFADNARAEAWAASDESGRSAWQTVRYRMTAGYPGGTQPTQWNDFIFGLLDAGECLVDDLSVVESPGGAPVTMVGNGDFESGLSGWRLLGTHRHSRVIPDPDNPANHVLHLVATGPQEHMHNHIETTLLDGRSVVNGREYEVSYRARWLAGNNRLNTRLYFNRVARTTVLPMPALNGTPGARNSSCASNIGPTFTALQHTPVVPDPGVPVFVSVAVQDPQGILSATLWWSANGGAWSNAPLATLDGTNYAAQIPGRTAGTIVQFYVRAVDGLGAAADYPPDGPDSGALYVVKDSQFDARRGHNLRLLLTPANRDLLHAFTNVMSNDELPATVICDERRAHYDVGLRLKGSQRGRYSDTRVSFHLKFQPDDLFRDVHPVMLIDRSGAGDSTSNKQLEILIKHLLTRVGGIAGPPADLCKVIAPRSAHSGSAILAPRHEDEFIETAYENGGDGTLFELELIYYPLTANAAGYKNPQPDNVLGVDLQDLGADPELYRYNFLIKNHRDEDNYGPFMRFARTLSLSGTTLDQQTRAVMDVEAWMRTWALVTLCGVGDSYTFGNDHNLMMYRRPADGRFVPFPVDMDFSFYRGANDGLIGDRNLSRVINLPGNRRLFYAHLLDIIAAGFNPTHMGSWIAHYNSFVPEQNFASIAEYIRQRGNYAVATINAAGGNAPVCADRPRHHHHGQQPGDALRHGARHPAHSAGQRGRVADHVDVPRPMAVECARQRTRQPSRVDRLRPPRKPPAERRCCGDRELHRSGRRAGWADCIQRDHVQPGCAECFLRRVAQRVARAPPSTSRAGVSTGWASPSRRARAWRPDSACFSPEIGAVFWTLTPRARRCPGAFFRAISATKARRSRCCDPAPPRTRRSSSTRCAMRVSRHGQGRPMDSAPRCNWWTPARTTAGWPIGRQPMPPASGNCAGCGWSPRARRRVRVSTCISSPPATFTSTMSALCRERCRTLE